jgi:hypothetical protein
MPSFSFISSAEIRDSDQIFEKLYKYLGEDTEKWSPALK